MPPCCTAAVTAGKQAIGRVIRLFRVGVTQLIKESFEFPALPFFQLDTYQHPAISRTMVTVMEQTDVPATTQA